MGVLLGGEAFVSSRDVAGNHVRGFGDTSLVLKRAFLVDDVTAFDLEFSAKIPTARNDIDSGKSDYAINGIYSRDLGKVHMDANLNFTRLGLVDEGTGRTQTGLSASFSTPISERWGATAELSGTRRAGADSTSQALLATTYSPSKRLTIDFGVLKGLNRTALHRTGLSSPGWCSRLRSCGDQACPALTSLRPSFHRKPSISGTTAAPRPTRTMVFR